jgi:hypothetical protein
MECLTGIRARFGATRMEVEKVGVSYTQRTEYSVGRYVIDLHTEYKTACSMSFPKIGLCLILLRLQKHM